MFLALAVQAEDGLEGGYWQHEKDSVWIEMLPSEGEGIVVRHDERPDSVGFRLVTNLAATDKPDTWSARVYAAQLQEYREADITLKSSDLMAFTVKVGFIRRTVEWRRVQEVPIAVNGE
jgi:hypothetical protein